MFIDIAYDIIVYVYPEGLKVFFFISTYLIE